MPALGALVPLIGILLKMLIVRIIIASGATFVTIVGYHFIFNQFKGFIANAVNSMPADIYNLFMIGGFGSGLGYLLGAISFRLTMQTLAKLTFRPQL